MNKKIILIDGSSMLMSNYYGSLPIRGENELDKEYFDRIMHTQHRSNVIYTNGISVTLKKILSLINKYHPAYMAVAFDKSRNTFRREEYPEYKGTRSEAPEPLKQQIIEIQKILKAINIPVFASDKFEADDIIASIVKNNCSADLDVMIITKDHDYYQLASDNVTIWQPQNSKAKTDELYFKYGYSDTERAEMPPKTFPFTPSRIFDATGVMPYQIPDLKGLMGDISDNIPGVKGISAMTAAPLLRKYDTIEGIYSALESDEKNFISECKKMNIKRCPTNALKNGKSAAFMSKRLATMAIFEVIENIKSLSLNINIPELEKIISEYEITSAEGYVKTLSNWIESKKESTENILNVAIIGGMNADKEKIAAHIKYLTSAKISNIYSNYPIKDVATVPLNIEEFNKMDNRAVIFVVYDGITDAELQKIILLAKEYKKQDNIQIRFCVVKNKENLANSKVIN